MRFWIQHEHRKRCILIGLLQMTRAALVQVDEVLAYSAALNEKNKVIADYWADYNHSNLPPGDSPLWLALPSKTPARTCSP